MASFSPQPQDISSIEVSERMIKKCEQQDFPCINVSYEDFDRICAQELCAPIRASQIVNECSFCVNIPINEGLSFEDLKTSDFLKGLNKKIGLYHLWIDYDECEDHDTNTLLCVYVGKGFAKGRIMDHINKKYSHLTKLETLFCSFYECSNRIAKYLEQLFLDLYKFESNEHENRGANYLFAVWNRQRYLHGTEIQLLADIASRRDGFGRIVESCINSDG
jgi:hypothetical protein